MGDAPQRRFDAAEHDGHARHRAADQVRVDDAGAVRAQAGLAAGRVLILGPHLLLRGQLVQHAVEVARGDADEEARSTQTQHVVGPIPARLGDEPHAVAATLEEASDQHRSERRVVDVRVAADDQDIQLVPAARVHLLARGRQEGLQLGARARASRAAQRDEVGHVGQRSTPATLATAPPSERFRTCARARSGPRSGPSLRPTRRSLAHRFPEESERFRTHAPSRRPYVSLMDASERRAHWEHVYQTRAVDEVSWYQPTPESSLALIERAGVAKDAPLIDVGGGASTLVDSLVERGFSDLDRARRLGAGAVPRSDAARRSGRARTLDRGRRHPRRARSAVRALARPRRLPFPGRRGRLPPLPRAPAPIDGPRRARDDGHLRARRAGALQRPAGPAPLGRDDARALGLGLELLETRDDEHRTPAGKIERFTFALFTRV